MPDSIVIAGRHGGPAAFASVAVSIVSHGHGQQVAQLVEQLHNLAEPCLRRVIVTLNVPEPALAQQLQRQRQAPDRCALEIICNNRPAGFAHNHNAALRRCSQVPAAEQPSHVCILNPDLLLRGPDPLARLAAMLEIPGSGLAYPRMVGSDGQLQDNERELPSPANLWRRRVLGRQEARVDWVSGACLMLRLRDWQHLGGFDEGFHMYCEDVDLSLRVRRDVGQLLRADTTVEHQAQRASHRRLRHLLWHVHSLLRLWRLPSYHWARQHPGTALRGQA